MKKSIVSINKTSLAVILFSVVIYISGFIAIDPESMGMTASSGFPIGLQNMSAVCAGILLGGPQGAAAAGLYIMLGALGLPVFSTGSITACQGIARLTGESGGFILGYFFAAAAAGFMMGKPSDEKPSIRRLIKASLASYALIYVFGIAQFLKLKGFTLSMQHIKLVFSALILPYLPFDAFKLLLTVIIGFYGRPLIARAVFLPSNNS